MAPAKTRKHQKHPYTQPISDVDLEPDVQNHSLEGVTAAAILNPPPPTRTNAELNLSVLQRHYPDVVAVLSIAPYAVIYTFSPSTTLWEKTGVEGTLFVVQLLPNHVAEERYAVVVLNRRGMDNFELELQYEEDVDITDDYVILQRRTEQENDEPVPGVEHKIIHGLWIFMEPPPSSTADMRTINARLIQDCSAQAEASRLASAKHHGQVNDLLHHQQHYAQESQGTDYTSQLQEGYQHEHNHSNVFRQSTTDEQHGNNLLGLFQKARHIYQSNDGAYP